MDALPVAGARRPVTPPRPTPQDPQDALDEPPSIDCRPPTGPRVAGPEVLQTLPVRETPFIPLRHAPLLHRPCMALSLPPSTSLTCRFRLVLSDGKRVCLTIRKGRNGNIPVHVDNVPGARELASLEKPFTIYFHPSVSILDEPASHLHPNNQRLLCKLLQGVAEERDTQVFLTTHSRHVGDALSGQATFLWVHNGIVEKMEQDHDLAILLDIGALDVKEMLSQSHAKCIVLTEDALKRGLEVLLSASGIPMDDTLTLAYYGCTSPHNLRPLLELIRASNPQAKIVVHRDRDYLTDKEGTEWETEIRNMEAEPFLTLGVDIESHFLRADHLAELNEKTEAEMDQLLRCATEACRELSIEKYVNGRTDIE